MKKTPVVESAEYGVLEFGPADKKVAYVLMMDANGNLYVDSNGNGDLTDDLGPEWAANKYTGRDGNPYEHKAGAFIINAEMFGARHDIRFAAYRFGADDPAKAEFRKTLFYYPDYCVRGRSRFGGESYVNVVFMDYEAKGDWANGTVLMFVDLDSNNKFDLVDERFEISEPINVSGKTYDIDLSRFLQGSLYLRDSTKTVEQRVAPAWKVGDKMTGFVVKDDFTDAEIRIMRSYMGKVVLIEVWSVVDKASMDARKVLTDLYKTYSSKGFDILSLSHDGPGLFEKVRAVREEHKIGWGMSYEGKGANDWCKGFFRPSKLPYYILVDGDTLKVLAVGGEITTDTLARTVEEALLAKKR